MNIRRHSLIGAVALAAALAAPAAAAADCPQEPLTRTFLPWLDGSWYKAVDNGGVESGADGWTLARGAAVVDGNQPYLEGGHSLSLPPGGVATTPPVCVDLAHPTVRFFARGGSPLTPLAVSVRFTDPVLGVPVQVPIGVMAASASWNPSPVLAMVGNALSGAVSFRFTSAGTWRLDDVYVDPYSKG